MVRELVLEYVPKEHTLEAVEPVNPQNDPIGQMDGIDIEPVSQKLPTGHGKHELPLDDGEKVPAGHATVCVSNAAPHIEPAGQTVGLDRPLLLQNDPTGQG